MSENKEKLKGLGNAWAKNWREYLLEFFMLFLAVSLGFLADNVRENISDNAK
jgi:hypothetical protein